MPKFGYVAIIGKPNVGKSTLINALVGEKVSIVTWKPQTTRDLIQGVVNGEDYQIVFVDTPGIQQGQSGLSKYMSGGVDKAVGEIKVIVYMFNGSKPISIEERKAVAKLAATNTVIAVINKQDIANPEEFLSRVAEVGEIDGLSSIIPMSVHKRNNTDFLVTKIVELLDEGEPIFDEDTYTDRPMRFMVAEIVREKAMIKLDDEIPYGVGVAVEKYEIRENGITDIDVIVYCEKAAHKAIIIGKGGSRLKEISTAARVDIEKLTGGKVFLTVWVKVKEDWRNNAYLLNYIGYKND